MNKNSFPGDSSGMNFFTKIVLQIYGKYNIIIIDRCIMYLHQEPQNYKNKKKEGTDFIMRKSIKALSAVACAAAVAFTTFAPTAVSAAEIPTTKETLTDADNTSYDAIDPYSLTDEKYFTLAGGVSEIQWAPLAVNNIMEADSHAGVYKMTVTFPAFDSAADKAPLNDFKLCTIDNTVLSNGWDHALIAGTTFYGDNMSRFRVECSEETEATVYWDTTTGAVVILDKDGNEIEYKISFCGYDNELVWMSVADMSKSSFSDYAQDKVGIAQGAGCTAIPDLESLNKDLVKKLSAEADPNETTAAPETSAETTAAPAQTTVASAQTTAANQSTKTGDAAPVAVVVMLCAAVAGVFATKKKNA